MGSPEAFSPFRGKNDSEDEEKKFKKLNLKSPTSGPS